MARRCRVRWRALSQARVQLPFVGAPIVDLNGEKWRSEEYGHAMIRVPQTQWNSTSVDVPASSVGDIGAATTALHVKEIEPKVKNVLEGISKATYKEILRLGSAAKSAGKAAETLDEISGGISFGG